MLLWRSSNAPGGKYARRTVGTHLHLPVVGDAYHSLLGTVTDWLARLAGCVVRQQMRFG
jgi:hypothetical protein